MTFNFTRQVKDADSKLPEKLHAEIPLILQKCIRAYLDYSQHEHRDVGNIWDVLPSYFLDVRKEIEESVSPLDKYLNSSEVVLDPNHRCPSSAFRMLSWCSQTNGVVRRASNSLSTLLEGHSVRTVSLASTALNNGRVTCMTRSSSSVSRSSKVVPFNKKNQQTCEYTERHEPRHGHFRGVIFSRNRGINSRPK